MRKYKYFRLEEFDSPDVEGSGELMEHQFMERLDVCRDLCQFPLIITSGYRTVEHNRAVGGSRNSSHLLGWAADIAVTDSQKRYLLINAAIEAGFLRIGIGKNFLHLDCDPEKEQVCMWTYSDR